MNNKKGYKMIAKKIKWKRIAAGEYVSIDRRFRIKKMKDRLFGEYWGLQDLQLSTFKTEYMGIWKARTLALAKNKAAKILNETNLE